MKSKNNKNLNASFVKILPILLLLLLFILFHTKNNYNSKYKMSLVVPIISRDFEKISLNFKFYKRYINCIYNLVLIGDKKIRKLIRKKKSNFEITLNFINEKKLLKVDKIKNLIKKRNKHAINRSGWYIQQFLKMQYCKVCNDKYYLIWDGDTIPIKEVKMFSNYGKPILDVKTEYHKQYFITMKKIFPELGKKYNYSFISEHMLIKTEMMKNLINRIEINNKIVGDTWYEKIINSIDEKDLEYSGFSEFETYGTFVNHYYKKIYYIRRWRSLRLRKHKYKIKCFTDNEMLNISKKYDAISFEK